MPVKIPKGVSCICETLRGQFELTVNELQLLKTNRKKEE
jgi:hypothetical protein